MNLQLLGSPTISLPNRLVPTFKTAKAAALFYYLVTTQRTYSRATLATLFWGDMAETKARVNLSKALSELREQVGDYVTIATQTVAFNDALPYELDVSTFLAVSPPHELGDALAVLQARADLYRGDFLEGFHVRNAPDFEQWLLVERERLRSAAVQLFANLATGYQQSGQLPDAINTVRQLLIIEPWREEAHYQLMELLAHTGETQAALRQYEWCRATLADELAIEPGVAITRLHAQLRAKGKTAGTREHPTASPLTHAPAVVQAPATLPSHLPQPATSFVGRDAEIKLLVGELTTPGCRLLTLVGPGGMGKTRLALAVARQLLDGALAAPTVPLLFPEGLFFVDLMAVDSAAGMIAAIADALGFTFYSNTPPQQQLFNYLKPRRLLLILDNFEHLLPESALVAELLAIVPGLKLLVTSRDALPLHAAYCHAVQGLAYPTAQAGTAAVAADAVRLFAQCARRHQPTFVLASHLDNVLTICRVVGGLPLALELAAAWLKSLTCAQIAQELTKGVELLHTKLVDLPERHRDMRMVFAQSWQRLPPEEAAVMGRLAIFRGGFTLAAAEQVAQASLYTLAALVERALIRLDETGRYQVHELLRQFSYEKLIAEPTNAQAAAAAHANFFLTLASQVKTNLEDSRQQAALATLQADIDNLRTAWLWALQQPELPGIAVAMDSLYAFFLYTCRYNEGKELFTTSQTLLKSLSGLVATLQTQLTTRAAVFAYHLGEYEQPSQHFASLLAADPRDELQPDIAIAHSILGQIVGWRGNPAEAVAHLQESVTLFQRLDDHSSVALVLYRMAEIYEHAWDYQQALKVAQACLAIGVQLGRNDLIASAHLTLGSAYKGLGQPKLALEHYRQGYVYSEKTQDRLAYGLAVGGVGTQTCHLYPKQWAQGFTLLQQSLTICRELGHFVHVITRLILLGLACLDGKRYAEAIPFAEECVQIGTAANFQRAINFGLRILATSCYEMGEFAMGRLHLQQAVRKAIEGNDDNLTHAFIIYGLLLEKEAPLLTATAAKQNRMEAVTLATVALRRPVWHEYYEKAEHLLARQKVLLSAEQFATAQALTDQHTLEALATQIFGLEPGQNDRC
jgi:DNA-binding SARP family transcriptional activator/predicted ATPase